MARYQNGSVRIEQRRNGPTWVYRFQITRSDGKRVEHTAALGSVEELGTTEKDAALAIDFSPRGERPAHMVNSVGITWKTS